MEIEEEEDNNNKKEEQEQVSSFKMNFMDYVRFAILIKKKIAKSNFFINLFFIY